MKPATKDALWATALLAAIVALATRHDVKRDHARGEYR
jgi:hypothetical protein